MISFVSVTVLASAMFYDAMDWGKVLVAFGFILCPILSITSSYGIISLLGIRTNSLTLVMPFLAMGIGQFPFRNVNFSLIFCSNSFHSHRLIGISAWSVIQSKCQMD